MDVTKLGQYQEKLSQLEKAHRDADRLRQEAIAELLQMRKQISRELRQLGYEGVVDETGAPSEPRRPALGIEPSYKTATPRLPKRRPAQHPERHCPVCNLGGHDLRAHRSQPEKVPFTAEELQVKGLAS